MNLGSKIKEYRELNKLTVTALAEIIGTSREYLSSIENNKKTPSFVMVDKIASALGINSHDLLVSKEDGLTPELKRLIFNARQLSPQLLASINDMIEAIINNK